MNNQQSLGFIDLLAFYSLYLQLQNQQDIASGKEIQKEINEAVEELHKHLEKQDNKIDRIMEVLQIEDHQGDV